MVGAEHPHAAQDLPGLQCTPTPKLPDGTQEFPPSTSCARTQSLHTRPCGSARGQPPPASAGGMRTARTHFCAAGCPIGCVRARQGGSPRRALHRLSQAALPAGMRRARRECAQECSWAEARIKIARMTLTIKLDRNWSRFQLANSAPPLSVTDSTIAPSTRMYSTWPGVPGASGHCCSC